MSAAGLRGKRPARGESAAGAKAAALKIGGNRVFGNQQSILALISGRTSQIRLLSH